MYIVYTFYGINKVKNLYITNWSKNYKENVQRIELKIIYDYLIRLNSLYAMDENKLQKEILMNMWGKEFEVVPQKMFKSTKVSYNNIYIYIIHNIIFKYIFYT